MPGPYLFISPWLFHVLNSISILFHISKPMHTMHYLITKEETNMAFDGVDSDGRRPKRHFEGIAIVVVIILLLIAMGIVF